MKLVLILLVAFSATALLAKDKGPFSEKHTTKITEAMTISAKVKVTSPKKALVYYKASGFRHGSIPTINKCLSIMGEKTGAFTCDFSDKAEDFSAEKLKNYDLLIFNNTTKLQKAFKTPE
jgi:type 1 glutamine amidotransferase